MCTFTMTTKVPKKELDWINERVEQNECSEQERDAYLCSVGAGVIPGASWANIVWMRMFDKEGLKNGRHVK